MENYLLAFPFPCMASLTPGFALFFHVGQNFKGGSLLFIPNFFNHSHLKKQICLRPVITCAWAEQGFLLNSLVCLEGQFEKSHHSMGISTCVFCLETDAGSRGVLRCCFCGSLTPHFFCFSLSVSSLSPHLTSAIAPCLIFSPPSSSCSFHCILNTVVRGLFPKCLLRQGLAVTC